jgi:hypothetical protein
MAAAGIAVNEVYHIGPNGKASGLHPERLSFRSFASFQDPDGNHWVLQEITTRLPGRTDAATTSFGSAGDLANALQRAAVAHGEHEKRTGGRDENWPAWYADYMVPSWGAVADVGGIAAIPSHEFRDCLMEEI